jgi:hypothetical protein
MKEINKKPAFYKQVTKPSEFWSVSVDWVKNKDYQLFIQKSDSYDYPVDGWEYHETPPKGYVDWWNENFSDEDEDRQ